MLLRQARFHLPGGVRNRVGVPREEWGLRVGVVVGVQGERDAGCFHHQIAAAEIQEWTDEWKTKPVRALGCVRYRVAPENSCGAVSQRKGQGCLMRTWFSGICSLTRLHSVSQKTSVVKRKPKRTPASLCWTRSCLCTGGTATRRCTPAATSTQGEGSTSSSSTTPTPCGGQSQSTTESITLDKDVVTESGV